MAPTVRQLTIRVVARWLLWVYVGVLATGTIIAAAQGSYDAAALRVIVVAGVLYFLLLMTPFEQWVDARVERATHDARVSFIMLEQVQAAVRRGDLAISADVDVGARVN